MISINFFWAIAIYLFLFIFILICAALFYNNNQLKKNGGFERAFFRHCPICSHIFFDYSSRDISTCPYCQSLVSKSESQ